MKDFSSKTSQQSTQVLMTYVFFIGGGAGVYHLFSDGYFSFILTLSVLIQCFGLALLALQVLSTGKATGISANTLILDGIALCCRLSNTLWLNGYVPADKSGDHVFQMIDITSICLIAWLIYQVKVKKSATYQIEDDTFPAWPMVLGSLFLASIFHANLNHRPIFDTLWMAGLFMGSVAPLPQLWLIARTGHHVMASTSHHIAAVAASKMLASLFIWAAREDISCRPYIDGFNHSKWAVLTAHLLHMVLIGDFVWYYCKAVAKSGLSCQLDDEFPEGMRFEV